MKSRRSLFALLSLTLLLTVASVATVLEQPQRVKFARGRTTALLRGTVKEGRTKYYVLGASAGQTMTVHVTSKGKNVEFTLSSPDDILSDPTDDFSGELPADGDYTISVMTQKAKPQSYTLEVGIR